MSERVGLVTGASRGIGRATARQLAEAGVQLALLSRSKDELDLLAAELTNLGADVIPVVGDVRDRDMRERFVKEAIKRFGRIDYLVSNASNHDVYIEHRDHPPEEILWSAHFDTDLMGAVHLTELVKPQMFKDGGAIVFVSSVAGRQASGARHGYTSMKAALIAAAKSLSIELAPRGIRVNSVAPGPIYEVGNDWHRIRETDPERFVRTQRLAPGGRFGTPDEVANVIVFLLSERASWIVGQCIVVDGGQLRGL